MVATIAAGSLLVLATAACLALLVPTLAGLLPRQAPVPRSPTHTFAILIPAHNEEHGLPATLRSVAELDYPHELLWVCVVADNCTDGTATVARSVGVNCIVRDDPDHRGKGFAVALGLQHMLRECPDVVLILDADCQMNPSALRALDTLVASGAEAVQCAVRSLNADDGTTGYVAAVGAAVDEAIAAGMDRLRLSVPLRGTGMAFRRDVLERVPWTAFGLVEDAEYATKLRCAGVRVRHCDSAVVTCDSPGNWADLGKQRRRWRTAGVLSSKPLGLGLIALAAAFGFACRFVWWPASLLFVTAGIYGRAAVAVGLTPRRIGLLLKSPGVVARLAWVTLAGLFQRKPATWERTPRPGETESITERRAA